MISTTTDKSKRTGQYSILVVEDEPTLATAIGQRLASEGWNTRIAGDGATAVDLAAAYKPDLIIMDIMLPVMDGLEATKRITLSPSLCLLHVMMRPIKLSAWVPALTII